MLQKTQSSCTALPASEKAVAANTANQTRNEKQKSLRQLVFKIALRADAALWPRQPYQLAVGSMLCHVQQSGDCANAVVIIDSGSDYPLKSHAVWLQRLVSELQQSSTEPKLTLLAVRETTLLNQQQPLWLTAREQQMLRYRHQGLTAKESATQLGISHRTVEKQLEHARTKLGGGKLSPHALNALFNTYRIIETYIKRRPPAVGSP